ncbi:hypothetical protein [Thalassotalea sp. SU-HH00458]|uniref:hypothetical protein n=1 Tax=Thalassotalea sp. SU-HH00458 TaxID=3127657 RepID=UPI0033659EE6
MSLSIPVAMHQKHNDVADKMIDNHFCSNNLLEQISERSHLHFDSLFIVLQVSSTLDK